MSSINTGAINVNYPSAGVNNSSQGFRDNFSAIKTSLDTTKTELEDLQSNALVKKALSGTTMDNNMAGGLISNVLTLGFRKTVYSLGNNLKGSVTVDCTKGDVQTGTVTDDISLDFSKWAPSDTMGTVEVILTVVAGQTITLPESVENGLLSIEGYTYGSLTKTITVPNGVTRIHWMFTTLDCGTTIEISQIDGPRIASQIKIGSPSSSIGSEGDKAGRIMITNTHLYVCVADYTDGTTNIWSKTPLGTTAW
jgi:hypothetical protein